MPVWRWDRVLPALLLTSSLSAVQLTTGAGGDVTVARLAAGPDLHPSADQISTICLL